MYAVQILLPRIPDDDSPKTTFLVVGCRGEAARLSEEEARSLARLPTPTTLGMQLPGGNPDGCVKMIVNFQGPSTYIYTVYLRDRTTPVSFELRGTKEELNKLFGDIDLELGCGLSVTYDLSDALGVRRIIVTDGQHSIEMSETVYEAMFNGEDWQTKIYAKLADGGVKLSGYFGSLTIDVDQYRWMQRHRHAALEKAKAAAKKPAAD